MIGTQPYLSRLPIFCLQFQPLRKSSYRGTHWYLRDTSNLLLVWNIGIGTWWYSFVHFFFYFPPTLLSFSFHFFWPLWPLYKTLILVLLSSSSTQRSGSQNIISYQNLSFFFSDPVSSSKSHFILEDLCWPSLFLLVKTFTSLCPHLYSFLPNFWDPDLYSFIPVWTPFSNTSVLPRILHSSPQMHQWASQVDPVTPRTEERDGSLLSREVFHSLQIPTPQSLYSDLSQTSRSPTNNRQEQKTTIPRSDK